MGKSLTSQKFRKKSSFENRDLKFYINTGIKNLTTVCPLRFKLLENAKRRSFGENMLELCKSKIKELIDDTVKNGVKKSHFQSQVG